MAAPQPRHTGARPHSRGTHLKTFAYGGQHKRHAWGWGEKVKRFRLAERREQRLRAAADRLGMAKSQFICESRAPPLP